MYLANLWESWFGSQENPLVLLLAFLSNQVSKTRNIAKDIVSSPMGNFDCYLDGNKPAGTIAEIPRRQRRFIETTFREYAPPVSRFKNKF